MQVVVNAVSAHQGGIVTYTKNLVRYLPAAGAEAVIYAPLDFPGIPVPDGVQIKRIEAGGYGNPRRFLWEQLVWPQIVRETGAKILFSSANYGVLQRCAPQVLLVQGEISFNPFYRRHVLPRLSRAERASFALRRKLVLMSAHASDLVIFPSQTSMESVLQDAPSLQGKSVVNFLAVNESFHDAEPRRTWREDGCLRLLYVSIYYPHKDPLTLQRAVGHLQRRGMEVQARISMDPSDFTNWSIGPAELIPLLVAEQAGTVVMGRIHHTEVRDVMANHDVLVSPSLAETFGFPLVEAMGFGIPVIVADTAIHHEICGDVALYFTPGSSHELCERILELDANPELRARCRDRGKARVRANFAWDKHMSGLVDCFRRVAP